MKTDPLTPLPSTTLEHLRPDQICDEPPALFSLGHVVATHAALALIQEHGASIQQVLTRHQTGDWRNYVNKTVMPTGRPSSRESAS